MGGASTRNRKSVVARGFLWLLRNSLLVFVVVSAIVAVVPLFIAYWIEDAADRLED
jgi:hypothetical protein